MAQQVVIDWPILHVVSIEVSSAERVVLKVGSEACELHKNTQGVFTTFDLRALSECCHRLFGDDCQAVRGRFCKFVERHISGRVSVPDTPPYSPYR